MKARQIDMLRRVRIIGISTIAVVAALGLAYAGVAPRLVYARQRAVTQQLLDSTDIDERIRGAWRVIDHPDPMLVPVLVQNIMGDEAEPRVREACLYTLGKLGNLAEGAAEPAIHYALDLEPSDDVRAAAWLAFARVDEMGFRERAEAGFASATAAEQIAIAEGLLELGDASRFECLPHWATTGDESVRRAASWALYKFVRPLLEAAGRWPLDPPVKDGDAWPVEFVSEIAGRCRELDLRSLARETRAQLAGADRLRSTLRRITGARERIARWLYSE